MAIEMGTVQIISTVAIAIATFTYATLTYLLLREQRKERDKIHFQQIADVLICPWIRDLDANKKYLKNGEVHWWSQIQNQTPSLYHPIKLIKISGSLDRITKLVYDDFKRMYPKIAEKIEKHDEEVERLKEVLDKFANNIKSLPDFEKKVLEKFEEYKRVAGSSDTSHFEPTTVILGYIVSNRQELDYHYSDNDFWNQNREELLEFREKPDVKSYKTDIENRCANLLELTDEILEDLEVLVIKYRKKYRINTEELLTRYIGQ